MTEIKRNEAIKVMVGLTDSNYKVTFVKLDGKKRKMIARQGVRLHGEAPSKELNGIMLTTFDVDKFQHRKINLATMTRLEIAGTKYKVVD